MSDYLKGFLSPNGSTSWQGQQNAGAWEAKNAAQPATQRTYESADAYYTRINSYNNAKKGG
jgi:hypothetical protein